MMKAKVVSIKPVNMKEAVIGITGTSPLVQHRFSVKVGKSMLEKMEAGSTAKKGKQREAVDLDELYNSARYIHKDGWDGFNASSIRNALISACRLVGFKMTIAKLSVFVIEDGRDKFEPQIPLVRIYGKPRRLEMRANVETGQAYMTVRPIYDDWSAKLHIRYDADQFTLDDVVNLLSRVGQQVGIGEGRHDSKNSAGMGWGCFKVDGKKEVK